MVPIPPVLAEDLDLGIAPGQEPVAVGGDARLMPSLGSCLISPASFAQPQKPRTAGDPVLLRRRRHAHKHRLDVLALHRGELAGTVSVAPAS